jgi:hypothetical protein
MVQKEAKQGMESPPLRASRVIDVGQTCLKCKHQISFDLATQEIYCGEFQKTFSSHKFICKQFVPRDNEECSCKFCKEYWPGMDGF